MKLDIDVNEIKRLYLEEDKSTIEIADVFGCGKETIRKRMVENNIPRRGRGEANRKKGKNGILENPNRLRELYWEEEKSLKEIGEICGCFGGTVRRRMLEYDIPTRDRREAAKKSIMVRPDLVPSTSLSYVLGVCLGDGSVFKTKSNGTVWYVVVLEVKDREFAEEFHDCLENINLNPKSIELDYFQVRAYSKKFYKWYIKQDIDGIEKLVSQNEKFKASFIRGFYDSEGFLDIEKYTLCMSNNNEKIIRLVKNMITSLGFEVSLSLHSNGEWRLRILGGMEERNRFVNSINPSIPRRARIQKPKGEIDI